MASAIQFQKTYTIEKYIKCAYYMISWSQSDVFSGLIIKPHRYSDGGSVVFSVCGGNRRSSASKRLSREFQSSTYIYGRADMMIYDPRREMPLLVDPLSTYLIIWTLVVVLEYRRFRKRIPIMRTMCQ